MRLLKKTENETELNKFCMTSNDIVKRPFFGTVTFYI